MSMLGINSLRRKMLFIMAAGMLLPFALLYFGANAVLLNGYTQLEKDKMIIQINSAISLLNEQSDQLSMSVRDYAHWDDAYQFVLDKNPAFVESSLSDAIFSNFKLNALFIINSEGKTVYQRGVDHTTGKPWRIPELILQATRKGGFLIDPSKTNISGLFWTPQGICVVAAVDIVNSGANKPRRGTLIMLRLLDEPTIQHIETILGAKISVQALRDDDIAAISPNLIKGEKIVLPKKDGLVAGFLLVNAIGGDTKLVLSVQADRKIFEQGKSDLNFLYWASLLAAILLGVFSWLLDKLVLSRLATLNSDVKSIGHSTSTGERVKEQDGNDEIWSLTHGINHMLQRLDESQLALQLEKERAQVTLAGIADAVITSDTAGCVLYMNETAERLTGIAASVATGKTLQSLFYLLQEDKITPVDSIWLTDTGSNLDEVVLERSDGKSYIVSKSASALYDHDGTLFSTVTVLHDVTMIRALSNQLSYQARHDSLTGLINRYEFDRMTQVAIDDATTENRMHCIVYIDLDQFKIVNDTCGHMAGDQLLRQLAEHLKTKVRSADTLARLGGDEFALLLKGCDLEKAQKIVDGILTMVRNYRFNFDDKVFKVGASIGLAEISPNQNITLNELLSAVDSACYSAKKDGGDRVHTYHPNDSEVIERNNQLEWAARIHLALEKNQFVLHSQRMEGFLYGAEQHCELLIRMLSEDGTLYPPGYFFAAAERYRIMPKIDRWVVAKAFSIIAGKGSTFTDVCSINLSGQTLTDDSFLEYTLQQIKLHGVDPRRICFEITETAVIANLNKARQLMRALRELGCRFSLDDFGSGLSSFGYLKNLEVDFLKIDGMFVKSIVSNKVDRAMVESINNIGHIMGLLTIAEFAEDNDIINVLREIGVDYAQGYGVAMPVLFE